MRFRPSTSSGPERCGGYTLVEILLALTLMSMLLALAYGGLRASTRAVDKGQAILQDSSSIRMAHQFVRKQLNQMLPLVFEANEDQSEQTVFMGGPDWIRFVAPMPGYLGFGGPQVQELAIVTDGERRSLVLSHALLQGFEEQNLYERLPVLLLDDIEGGEFRFLGRDEEDQLTGWVSTWENPGLLPEAVSLDIEFGEEVYIQWPSLTASPRIDPAAVEGMAGAAGVQPANYRDAIQDMIKRRRNKE